MNDWVYILLDGKGFKQVLQNQESPPTEYKVYHKTTYSNTNYIEAVYSPKISKFMLHRKDLLYKVAMYQETT